MKFTKLIYIFFLIFSLETFGGVNLRNGDWYITYTDLSVPGAGQNLEITRTYNSKATKIGWFGFGWGSDYETYLTVAADGSVVVHENGSGAETRFLPDGKIDVGAAAERILEAMKKQATVTDTAANELKDKLKKDAELRRLYARKYKVKANVAVGTKLRSTDLGLQFLLKTKDGYERDVGDGKTEYFSDAGEMVKVVDKNRYTINFEYDNQAAADGRRKVKSITDSLSKQIFFDWYPNGLVKAVWSGVGSKKVSYKYKGKDLVYSKDVDENEYTYDYTTNHYMTKIGYSDKTEMTIDYWPKNFFVSKVVDRNKNATEYVYESNKKNPDLHYWTLVKRKGIDGNPVENRYEYEHKVRDDGSQFTYRILTKVNGLTTETTYDEKCALPKEIKRGKETTKFEYNAKCLMTKKNSTRGENIEISYDDKWNKIASVKNRDGLTKYTYDNKGNLKQALGEKGNKVTLFYNSKGQIFRMLEVSTDSKGKKKERDLSFEYNSLGKPEIIKLAGTGSIKVEYDNQGEIKNVDSKEGQSMALQVTQAFQNLLGIVRPAGVNLNF